MARHGARIDRRGAAHSACPCVALPIGSKRPPASCDAPRWLRANAVDIVNTHSSTDTWLAALALRSVARAAARDRAHAARVGRRCRATRRRAGSTREATARRRHDRRGAARAADPRQRHRRLAHRLGADRHRRRPLSRPATAQGARARARLAADGPLVGIVATLRSWKGHRFLLDAIARLRDRDARARDRRATGRSARRSRRRSPALGLRGRVRFAGQQDDVAPWLRALDVFALPSYANEGVPQALVQAMFAGAAVRHDRRRRDPRGRASTARPRSSSPSRTPTRSPPAMRRARSTIPRCARGSRRRARTRGVAAFGLDAMLDRMEAVFRRARRERMPDRHAARPRVRRPRPRVVARASRRAASAASGRRRSRAS